MTEPVQSLYIHIPFCISKCAYCDFFSKPFLSVPDDYVSALCNELDFRLRDNVPLKTVYIGGGTPSLLSRKQLLEITSYINLSSIEEFTCEVNPDDVTQDLLDSLKTAGVTRISCGIQSFDDKVLKLCNRRANSEQIHKAFDLFKQYWDGKLSLDFISGLPLENGGDFVKGLESAVKTGADHISLYALTIEEETPLGQMIESGKLGYDYERADELWLSGRDYLSAHGYVQYEVSNFSFPGNESRHNMTYWNHESYIGAGSGATGTIYKKDGTAFRWTNSSDLEKYTKFWLSDTVPEPDALIPQDCEELSRDTEIFEFFMMGLRTIKGISQKRFQDLFSQSLPVSFIDLMVQWEKKGLAEIYNCNGDTRYSLGSKGILFLNRFLQQLEF